MKFCHNCGEEIENTSEFCTYCGAKMSSHAQYQSVPVQQPVVPAQQTTHNNAIPTYSAYGTKYRIVAALLGFFFGTFGIHKFYLNKTKSGVLSLVFFWTGAPTIIGIVEAILYLTDDEEMFQQRMQLTDNIPKNPSRDRLVAAILGLIGLGGFGAHHFFMRNPRAKYFLIFCWTGIPLIVGFFEGLIYLLEPLENFTQRYYY
ncbi:hypothetical protein NEF87_001094 [Candidatus Lokiarchaeum ossiferum]|uniref:TM2 domain-containing protein n=1 Tax=Candidatus Lokiarchaeum ossiferum TaxID=2951803 RepID=A0ABY6HQF6_9ARCH|nr:hypothetical protein NEF87_001094 [Candidatus Lokiarchaeum sp. B-35]